MSWSPFIRGEGGRISGNTNSKPLYLRVLKDENNPIVGFLLVFVYAASQKKAESDSNVVVNVYQGGSIDGNTTCFGGSQDALGVQTRTAGWGGED